MSSYKISVVVPTHARRASLKRLLLALNRQTLPPSQYEAVVAIDGSHDGTLEMVHELVVSYQLRSLWQPQSGRAIACNRGIRDASGTLIVLLDDDMEPVPEFLEEHLAEHASGKRRGVVGAAPIAFDASSPPLVVYRGTRFAQKLVHLEQKDRLAITDVYTGNFSTSRDILLEADGYDEKFRLYGHEDYELALRLERLGVEFAFSPRAVALQHYTKTFRGLAHDTVGEGQTSVQFVLKQPEILPHLELSRFFHRSPRALARYSAFLALSRAWPRVPDLAIELMSWLEKRWPGRASTYYSRALDYLYWLGVDRALEAYFNDGRRRSLSERMLLLMRLCRTKTSTRSISH